MIRFWIWSTINRQLQNEIEMWVKLPLFKRHKAHRCFVPKVLSLGSSGSGVLLRKLDMSPRRLCRCLRLYWNSAYSWNNNINNHQNINKLKFEQAQYPYLQTLPSMYSQIPKQLSGHNWLVLQGYVGHVIEGQSVILFSEWWWSSWNYISAWDSWGSHEAVGGIQRTSWAWQLSAECFYTSWHSQLAQKFMFEIKTSLWWLTALLAL